MIAQHVAFLDFTLPLPRQFARYGANSRRRSPNSFFLGRPT